MSKKTNEEILNDFSDDLIELCQKYNGMIEVRNNKIMIVATNQDGKEIKEILDSRITADEF